MTYSDAPLRNSAAYAPYTLHGGFIIEILDVDRFYDQLSSFFFFEKDKERDGVGENMSNAYP